MSNPEPPTVRGSSNSARIPASLTSRHNPRKGEPAVTKSTWKPAAIRGSRYTNRADTVQGSHSRRSRAGGAEPTYKSNRPFVCIGAEPSSLQGIDLSNKPRTRSALPVEAIRSFPAVSMDRRCSNYECERNQV